MSQSIVVACALSLSGTASAATLRVDPSDATAYPRVSSAVAAAQSGDTIEVAPGAYLEAPMILSADVTIHGVSGTTTLTAAGSRLFTVPVGVTATLEGLTLDPLQVGVEVAGELSLVGVAVDGVDLTGVDGAAVLAHSGAVVSITDCRFTAIDAGAGHNGAAVRATNSAVTVDGTAFEANRAHRGGAIWASGGSLDVVASTFDSNQAVWSTVFPDAGGGAIWIEGGALRVEGSAFTANGAETRGNGGAIGLVDSDVTVVDSQFSANTAPVRGYGAAIDASGAGTLTASRDLFEGNTADSYGAVAARGDWSTVIEDSTFDANAAPSSCYGCGGGGLYFADGGTALVRQSTFADNTAYSGGALGVYGTVDVTVEDSTFTANESTTQRGGAIALDGDYATKLWTATVRRSTFGDNVGGSVGTAIGANSGVRLVVEDCSFVGNTGSQGTVAVWATVSSEGRRNRFCGNSAGHGGALSLHFPPSAAGGDVWTNNLFVDNEAVTYGGAIYGSTAPNHPWSFVNNTFVSNSTPYSGSVLWGAAAWEADFRNNIFAWNSDPEAALVHGGTHVPVEYDDFFGNTPADLVGFDYGANTLYVDPAFVAWSDDGDCTNDDLHLQPTSVLVDQGDPAILDPDGTRSDLGAYGGGDAPPFDWADADNDGVVAMWDCDDTEATVHRGAAEIPYDGFDNDCSGDSDLVDVDGDGSAAIAGGGDDCDDEDASIHPGAIEVVGNGLDDDCDPATPDSVDTDVPDTDAPDTDTNTSDTDDGDTDDGDTSAESRKCGCASDAVPGGGWLVALLLLAWRPRRDRGPAAQRNGRL